MFLTGHTGFKGSWLSLWLNALGAKVTGYALSPPSEPNVYTLCGLDGRIESIHADIRNRQRLHQAMMDSDPDIVIHMAAQPLVRESYLSPVETYEINVMGTVNLLEAVRNARVNGAKGIKVILNVTTDKCYENKEWLWGYRENDRLGGYDPYSNSKACSELVTTAYRQSYFNPDFYSEHGVRIVTARAGNVIGGGDWGKERLVPDCIRALLGGEKIMIRNPHAIRPWQHVLEPLSGYLVLAQTAYENPNLQESAWNFGPNEEDTKAVEWIVQQLCTRWEGAASYEIIDNSHLHEAHMLRLDCTQANVMLGWYPRWNLSYTLDKVLEWVRGYQARQNVYEICIKQINEYMAMT